MPRVFGFCVLRLLNVLALSGVFSWIYFLGWNPETLCVTRPDFQTSMASSYPVPLFLNRKNKFLLLSWLKIQHPGGWHVAQPAPSVCSLLNIGRGKHFHPHRLPPASLEWNWRRRLSSELSLVETHRRGHWTHSIVHRYSGKDVWAHSFCHQSNGEACFLYVKTLIRSNQMWTPIHWHSCAH